MKVLPLVVGNLSTNSYIVYDENKKEGIIIDPGDFPELLISKIKELGINLKYIVFTHVHFDHILGYPKLKKEFPESLLIVSHIEKDLLWDREKSLLYYVDVDFPKITEFEEVKNGDLVEFGDVSLKVIETPGHTEGSICLYGENTLFSGDTLFYLSLGRWDFPGGDFYKEYHSITEVLFSLPDDTLVYPGHGNKTTIGYEKINNEVVKFKKTE